MEAREILGKWNFKAQCTRDIRTLLIEDGTPQEEIQDILNALVEEELKKQEN